MATKTNSGLVQWANNWLGRPYWYGTCCYECTTSLLTRKTAQYPSHYTSSRKSRYEKDIKNKQYCTDCIGLVKGYMWTDEKTGKQTYGSNGCPDRSANGMMNEAHEKGTIATLPELPGLILWKSGHVGVYIGNGELVEARGFDYGVVRSKVSSRGFTHWFKQPGLAYSGESAPEQPEPDAALGERTLRDGSKGEDVRQLQATLNSINYDSGKEDGVYGSKTTAAVKAFQAEHGLAADGIYGALTHTALMDAILTPEETEKPDEDAPEYKTKVKVTGGSVNVRLGAGTQYPIATIVRKGEELAVPDTDGWVPVLYNGTVCWISKKYVE